MFNIDGVVCLADGEGTSRYRDDDQLNMVRLRRISFADLVVPYGADLVRPEHIEVIREWLCLHVRRVRIIEATRSDVPMRALLGTGRFDGRPNLEQNSTEHIDLTDGAGLDQ